MPWFLQLDYVIETNFSTIKCLEGVLKKMNRMPQDEAAKFRLDNSLGGTSECINRNSIQRIYGDKANDIIEGLKKNPVIAVPLVLRRLKAKDEEWREAQKQFNKLWKEQNEKFYLKSLDHQCANFKQHDIKAIRGKSLLNQIEAIYDERVDTEEAPPQGPMLTFTHEDRTLIEDAGNLIIHHVKRQTGVDKEAKSKIKVLVKHLVPDLFFAPRGELSDDDGDAIDDMDLDEEENAVNGQRTSETSKRAKDKSTGGATTSSTSGDGGDEKSKKKGMNGVKKEPKEEPGAGEDGEEDKGGEKTEESGGAAEDDDNDRYTLFYCNTTWYIFLRLHQILCARLLKAYSLTQKLIQDEELTKHERKESVAKALRLRTPLEVEVQDYYPYFMDMVRAVLDGNMESSQYEDTMREMYGIDAFQFFTMDKLVQNVVRQVQHLVMDDMPSRLTKLFEEQREAGGAGGRWATRHQRATLEQAYLRQAEIILGEENPFKFLVRSLTATMEIDMLDPPPESSTSVKETMSWTSYLKDFASGSTGAASAGRKKDEFSHRVGNSRPIYLVRNKKRNPNWEDFKLREDASVKGEEEDEEDGDDEGGETKEEERTKSKEGAVEVKEEPMEEGGEEKSDKEKESKPETLSSDGTSTAEKSGTSPSSTSAVAAAAASSSSATLIGNSVSLPSQPTGNTLEQKEAEDQDSSLMQDAATLASLSQGGRPLEEEDEEEEDTSAKRRGGAAGGDSDGGLGDDEDDEEKETDNTSGKRRKIGSSPDGPARRMHSVDTTSVKFAQNSYHHVFVNKTGLLMFQRNRIARTNA
ncbi:paired amphipathic helix protein Sin3a, partial [Elysia marginata]